jgi:hypothetical protein
MIVAHNDATGQETSAAIRKIAEAIPQISELGSETKPR